MKTIQQITLIILTLVFVCGCKQQVSIKGRVYVITRSDAVIKMAGVEVFMVEENVLRARIKQLNGSIQSAVQSAPSQNLNELYTKAQVEANLVTLMLENSETKGFHSTVTDSEGNYSFEGVRAGDYVLLARGTRDVGDDTEFYIWYKSLNLKIGYSYTIDLQNSVNILDIPTFQKISENDARKCAADSMWVGLMKQKYGLIAPDLR